MIIFYAASDGLAKRNYGMLRRVGQVPLLLTYFNIAGRQKWVFKKLVRKKR